MAGRSETHLEFFGCFCVCGSDLFYLSLLFVQFVLVLLNVALTLIALVESSLGSRLKF